MPQKIVQGFLFALMLVLIFASCKVDSGKVVEPISVDQIEGEWAIVEVLRNKKVTKSLENGFIVFHDDNTIESNILSGDNRHTFTYDLGEISIDGDANLKSFDIESLSGDTLVLNSKVASFDMVFTLTKKE